jgi:hypothetical protein
MERPAGRPSGDHQQRRQIVAEAVWSGLRDHGPDGVSLRAATREAEAANMSRSNTPAG